MAAHHCSDPLRFLIDWPASPACAQRVRGWSADPVLRRYPSAGAAALAASHEPAVFAALAARVDDPIAAAALHSAVAVHLRPVVSRWRAAGLRGADLDDAVADLLACSAAELQAARGGVPPDARRVAWRAWRATYHRRRSERRRARLQVPLDPASLGSTRGALITTSSASTVSADGVDSGLRGVLFLLGEAISRGTLSAALAASLWAAACGWPAAEAARRAGVSPGAWRARKHRAAVALQGSLGVGRGW
jgi:DNA-directed RNA polymerase specialized sigma24 family protein